MQGLSALTCPVMVLTAESDPSAPVAAARFIADQVAGAVLHVTPGSGHFPPIEAAGTFNVLLRRFLPE